MMMVTALMIVMKVHVRGNMSRSFIILDNFFITSYALYLSYSFPSPCWLKFHLFVRFCNCVSYPWCKSVYANIFLYKSFLQMDQSIIHFLAIRKTRWRLLCSSPRYWWSPPSSASRSLWRRRSGRLLLPLVPARGCSSTGATFTRETVCLDAHVRLYRKFLKPYIVFSRDWVWKWVKM